MAATRSSTGSSKPRILQQITNAVAPKKRTTTSTKANTSKPRTSTTTSGRVAKPKPKPKSTTTTTTTTKTTKTAKPNVRNVKKPRTKTEKIVDKITGNAEKLVGDVQGKPGKKAAGTRKSHGTDSMTKRRVKA